MEIFQSKVERSRQNALNDDTLKILLLRGIRDDCIDLLNLMGGGDVSLLKYVEICDLCQKVFKECLQIRKRDSRHSKQEYQYLKRTSFKDGYWKRLGGF